MAQGDDAALRRPMAAIIGGAKLSTKIPVILEQMDKVDRLIIGGAIVFTFLCALGYKVGRNKVEAEFLTQALEIARKAKKKGMKLLLPKDVVCCATMPFHGKVGPSCIAPAVALPDGWLGLDLGPAAIRIVKATIADCHTILWHGPVGMFETNQFGIGTCVLARYCADLQSNGGATVEIRGDSLRQACSRLDLQSLSSHADCQEMSEWLNNLFCDDDTGANAFADPSEKRHKASFEAHASAAHVYGGAVAAERLQHGDQVTAWRQYGEYYKTLFNRYCWRAHFAIEQLIAEMERMNTWRPIAAI